MFALLRKLIEMFSTVDSGVLLAILSVIQDLLKIGLPPDVEDEEAFRDWLGKLCDVLDGVADMSATEFDNKVVDLLSKAVSNDETWKLFYTLLMNVLKKPLPDVWGDNEVVVLSDRVGIDPATIIVIINLIIQLIDWFKKR